MKKKEEFPRRQHLSIGKEFKEVAEILDRQPAGSMSRFICEAILHYDKVKNNPDWYFDRIKEMRHFMLMAEEEQNTSSVDQSPPEETIKEEYVEPSYPVENQFKKTAFPKHTDTPPLSNISESVTKKSHFDQNTSSAKETELNVTEDKVTPTIETSKESEVQINSNDEKKRNIPPFMRR